MSSDASSSPQRTPEKRTPEKLVLRCSNHLIRRLDGDHIVAAVLLAGLPGSERAKQDRAEEDEYGAHRYDIQLHRNVHDRLLAMTEQV
jgi:hypothetical protein